MQIFAIMEMCRLRSRTKGIIIMRNSSYIKRDNAPLDLKYALPLNITNSDYLGHLLLGIVELDACI